MRQRGLNPGPTLHASGGEAPGVTAEGFLPVSAASVLMFLCYSLLLPSSLGGNCRDTSLSAQDVPPN
jgi:hypothetical protein